MSISIEPDRSKGGGYILVGVVYSGPPPKSDIELSIQKVQTKEWLSVGGWTNVQSQIRVPASSVDVDHGGLVLRLGPDIVNKLGYRTGLRIELPQLGVAGLVRLPESVQPGSERHGRPRDIDLGPRGPRSEIERSHERDTVGSENSSDVGAAPVASSLPEPEPPQKNETPPRQPLPPTPPPPRRTWPILLLLVAFFATGSLGLAWSRGWWPFPLEQPVAAPPQRTPVAINETLKDAVKAYDEMRRETGMSSP